MGEGTKARELSARLLAGGGVSSTEIRELMDGLTDDQRDRIRAKQLWEGVPLSGVLADWPSMFEPVVAGQGDVEGSGGTR